MIRTNPNRNKVVSFLNKYIMLTVNTGSMTNVNKILIENIVGKGRFGNEYNPFPTIIRSK
nr:hypothetical protein [Virgibacillus ndiopensis]